MLLGGRYELLRAIASGGMATVHLARAVGVGGFERLVAVKVMHPHIASETEFVAMFLDEARLAAQIRHPNVVATIDVQEAEDGLFLVMEFVDGPSLKRLRKRTDGDWRLPHGVLLRILVDALNGLHAAHELMGESGESLNLIHRDVSPANILVGADGVSRITDFGVARAETRLSSTRGGQLKGKVPYMPPEQLMAEPTDRRCDVYATGVVMWEELVGRRLFKAASEGALLQRILTGPEHSPSQVDPGIPAALDHVCMKALAQSPDDRFASAADMADAIENAAVEAGIRLASTRAVASFVETSGAHEALDPKKLAAIKRASRPGTSDPRAAMPSGGAFGSGPSQPSGASTPRVDALSSSPSQLSTAGATVSASNIVVQRSSNKTAIAFGGAIAVLGLVGGYFIATSDSGSDASAVQAGEAPAVGTSTPAVETAEASPSADATPTADTADTAETAPSASALASASASAAPSTPVVVPPPRTGTLNPRTPAPKVSPQPPSGSYNPERL